MLFSPPIDQCPSGPSSAVRLALYQRYTIRLNNQKKYMKLRKLPYRILICSQKPEILRLSRLVRSTLRIIA